MPGLSAFTAAASGLLGERLRVRRREEEMRRRIGQILSSRSFHPVFQPIVDLTTRGVVGYEALTRFDSGQRPDLCLADAWAIGLGRDLELATLEAAIVTGKALPSGRWLSLNVSPRLLDQVDRLRALLWGAERPTVVEVTEHEIIDDYGGVRDAIRGLGNDVRLAVDDAGAGTANFSHIVELRPDLVKLDISLVRRVNADLGRQALIVGMRHFSRTAGCRLIAEGIESEEEASTLRGFGVEFGQGFLFGRPEPVGQWATT
jgi:EAL domain-containing protein (putative c-di-GMP-specific phosphodiesterase class I)